MTTAIILLILFLLFLLWPRIMRALRPVIHRWMARRMENFIRKPQGCLPATRTKGGVNRESNGITNVRTPGMHTGLTAKANP